MAFQGTGLLSHDRNNYFSFTGVKPDEGKLPHTSEVILSSNHTYVVDSRQRDTRFFPNPNSYSVKIGTPFKNVTSIELKAAMLPRTEYNVNSSNNKIDFNIMDFITAIEIIDGGSGYNPDVSPFTVPLSLPPLPLGVAATAQIEIGPAGTTNQFSITSVTVVNSGQGYTRGYYGGSGVSNDGAGGGMNGGYWNDTGPTLQIPTTIGGVSTRANVSQGFGGEFKNAKFKIVVGEQLTATIPVGQYDLTNLSDGGTVPPSTPLPGLCCAVTRALQDAVTERYPNVNIPLPPAILGSSAGERVFPIGPPGPQTASSALPLGDNAHAVGSCYVVPTIVPDPIGPPLGVNTLITNGWLDGLPHNINGLGTVTYPPFSPNSSFFSRIVIQRGTEMGIIADGTGNGTTDIPLNIKGYFLELLWGSGTNRESSAIHLLGFGTSTTSTKDGTPLDPPLDQCTGIPNAPQPNTIPGPSWATDITTNPPKPGFNPSIEMPNPSTAVLETAPQPFIMGRNNYDLIDFPSYVILSFVPSIDRIESEQRELNEGFAVLLFDSNSPNVVWKQPLDPVQVAAPPDDAAQFDKNIVTPGVLKALKGYDFDKKIVQFMPPVAKLDYLGVKFSKYNSELYDFHGKDHVLIFEIGCNDINTGNRW